MVSPNLNIFNRKTFVEIIFLSLIKHVQTCKQSLMTYDNFPIYFEIQDQQSCSRIYGNFFHYSVETQLLISPEGIPIFVHQQIHRFAWNEAPRIFRNEMNFDWWLFEHYRTPPIMCWSVYHKKRQRV